MDKAKSAAERDRRSSETWFKVACVSGSAAMIMFGASAVSVWLEWMEWLPDLWGIYRYTFAAMCGLLIFTVTAMNGCQRALNRVKAHEDANGAVGEERVD